MGHEIFRSMVCWATKFFFFFFFIFCYPQSNTTLSASYILNVRCFMKYLLGVVSLIFPAKTLIWNRIMFPISKSLNLPEPVVNKPMKSIYKKKLPIFLPFLFDLSLLNVKLLRAYTQRSRQLFEILYQYSLLLIISYQSSSSGGEGS